MQNAVLSGGKKEGKKKRKKVKEGVAESDRGVVESGREQKRRSVRVRERRGEATDKERANERAVH